MKEKDYLSRVEGILLPRICKISAKRLESSRMVSSNFSSIYLLGHSLLDRLILGFPIGSLEEKILNIIEVQTEHICP